MEPELPHSGSGGSNPGVWTVGRYLYARAPLLTRLFSLFSYDRLMVVDRAKRALTMRYRWLWLIRREKTVSWSQVDYVDQDYDEIATSDGGHFHGSREVRQTFTVHLVLKKGRGKLMLFRFSGNMDSYHDGENSPRQAALAFMSFLAETMRVPAGPPVRHYASITGTMLLCSECGRRCGPAAVNCLYCGGALEEVAAVEENSTCPG